MTSRRHNAAFLTPEELAEYGIENAAERRILIHSTAVIVNFDAIRFASNIRIDPYVVLSCSDLQIGNYVHISTGAGIFGTAPVTLGDFSNLSAYSLVYSSNDDYSGAAMIGPMVPKEFSNVTHAPVEIGRHAVLAARSIVLPGCRLHEGVAVGAGSLVKHDLPEWTIYAGTPARPIKPRLRNPLALEEALQGLCQQD